MAFTQTSKTANMQTDSFDEHQTWKEDSHGAEKTTSKQVRTHVTSPGSLFLSSKRIAHNEVMRVKDAENRFDSDHGEYRSEIIDSNHKLGKITIFR